MPLLTEILIPSEGEHEASALERVPSTVTTVPSMVFPFFVYEVLPELPTGAGTGSFVPRLIFQLVFGLALIVTVKLSPGAIVVSLTV